MREGLGEDRRQARGVGLGVALPAAGRVDLREVGVANPIAVSVDRRHIERRAGAQEDGEDVRMSSIEPAAASLQTPQERRPAPAVPFIVHGVDVSTRPQ